TGDLLLFTDADCQVNPGWVKEMVCAFRASFGVVTGITAVRSMGFFAKMQAIDWWLTQSMIKGTADLAYSFTSMGNNMLISREAYWKVGGFQGLPFSVTEDFALAQAAIEKGYKPVQQVSAGALVMTKSEKNISELLKQRKRWMKGAMALPWYWIVLLALQCGFFPAMLFVVIQIWLPFSVTEDFALAQAAIEKGYKPVQQVSAGALVMTKSEKNISELLKQRKRWMKGAMALPWYWIVLLALQCGFFPAMLFVVI